MGSILSALLLVLGAALPAAGAAEMPTRKAGLWEMTMTTANGHGNTMQQCVDPQTDQIMQARAGNPGQQNCSKRDVQRSGTTVTIDSVCTVAGKTRTVHSVINGSFDSGYTMNITSQGEGEPAHTMTMAAKWLGPCAAGQRPGDMIMPNGMKMNVLDLQKGVLPSGMPAMPGAR
jgi:hypothetical protein